MEYRDIRRIARENLEGNYWLSVTVAFVAAIFGALITNASVSIDVDAEYIQRFPQIIKKMLILAGSVGGTLSLVQLILGGTVQLGYAKYLLNQHNHATLDIKDLFSQFDRFKEGFLQHFLRGLYVILWSLLFIIPGIIKAISYSMTPFIMAENPDMTAKQAIEASKELMDGHKGELFMLGLTFFGWLLLCVLTLGIGTFFLNPYMNAAYAAFYKNITAPKAANPDYYTN